jgi:hypothetical protein
MLLKTKLQLVLLLSFSLCLQLSAQDWNEVIKSTASDAAAGDQYGISVAIDGDYAIVGGSTNDDDGADSGAAYILIRSGSNWTEQAKLTASDGATTDQFGFSVDINGDYAIVGAFGHDANGTDSGAAYVFVRSGTTWIEQAKLTSTDIAAGDQFGISVALSGDTAIIGAFGEDGAGSNYGAVYIYSRSGSVWTEQTKLAASDAASNDQFGFSVDIDGNYVIVGSDQDDDGGSQSGSAYVFFQSGGIWNEQAKLTASDAASDNNFGRSVAIDGNYVLVGAYRDDEGALTDSGSAYVFERNGVIWTEQNKLIPADLAAGDQLGFSVDLDGNFAIIGARFDGDGQETGSAYIFENSGGVWSEFT